MKHAHTHTRPHTLTHTDTHEVAWDRPVGPEVCRFTVPGVFTSRRPSVFVLLLVSIHTHTNTHTHTQLYTSRHSHPLHTHTHTHIGWGSYELKMATGRHKDRLMGRQAGPFSSKGHSLPWILWSIRQSIYVTKWKPQRPAAERGKKRFFWLEPSGSQDRHVIHSSVHEVLKQGSIAM